MAGPVLIPSLVRLRADVDRLWPDRPTASDGWIGDKAHQGRVSDHNDDEVGKVPIRDADSVHEVHGLDITRFPQLDAVVRAVLARCRSGLERRLRYIIWDHVIYEAANDWRARVYDGDDPHTEHAHFSGSYDTAREADNRSWNLEVALTAPTADQNAQAVAGRDVDPGTGTYSLGGAIWTTLGRTSVLNQLPGQLTAVRDDLAARVDDVDDELDGFGASIVLLTAIVQSFLNDPAMEPNPLYDLIRQAVRDELNAARA